MNKYSYIEGFDMKEYRYKLKNDCNKEFLLCMKMLEANPEIKVCNVENNELLIETELSPEMLESELESFSNEIDLDKRYKTIRLSADIDCADCANKVSCALRKNNSIADATFDMPKGVLNVVTTLNSSDIMKISKEADSDIRFNSSSRKREFDVKIDCANCARKVEEGLNATSGVESASFNFSKGKLTVVSTLSDQEIISRCKDIEDDIEFLSKMNDYTFFVEIDCAECARKVEQALNSNGNVESATFDFPKGRLKVRTTLTVEEVKDFCLDVEDDMKFDVKEKKELDIALIRIILALVLFVLGEVLSIPFISVISYLIVGYDILFKAIRNIFKGKVFDENFLMAIATIGALFISSYEEAAGVMIFYQVGEYFQQKAVGKSRSSISALMDLTPDVCSVIENDEIKSMRCEDVKVGTLLQIKPGEKVAIDSYVVEGESFIDTKALTGESVPRKVTVGASVLSGSINGEGLLTVKTVKDYSSSTAAKIVKLVEDNESKKATTEKFITKFSRYYTPFVCISALLLAILPPLLGLMDFSSSIYRACVLLVISCPCALVLSIPLTYFASIGSFAKRGILVKGDQAIQAIARMDTLALDKTGTLTEGVFSVQDVHCYGREKDYIISLASALERNSSHPIATAILAQEDKFGFKAGDVREIPGIGLEGTINGKEIKVGSRRILKDAPSCNDIGTLIYVSEDDVLGGIIVISDRIKASSASAIRHLRDVGIRNIVMLSGDRKEIADEVSSQLGLDRACSELLPADKLSVLESLMGGEHVVGYAGDGINDAPSLKRADVGFSMGGVGSDVAIEASDAVVMNDDLDKIAAAVSIAKKTDRIVKENIVGSLLVKFIVFGLAIFGIANMWLGVFADTGVTFIAVLNAMRALKYKK